MRRRSVWQTVAIAVGAILVVIAALALIEPSLPGRWCGDDAIWRVCYRGWLGALSGWAAFAAAGLALLVARQQHLLATREVNAPLLKPLRDLIRRVERMVEHVGRQSLPRTADFDQEFLMANPELKRLEAVRAFKTRRIRAVSITRKWHGLNKEPDVPEAQKQLLETMHEIQSMLERGIDVPEIARELDDTG